MIRWILVDLVSRKKALVREPAVANKTFLQSAISFWFRTSVCKSTLSLIFVSE